MHYGMHTETFRYIKPRNSYLFRRKTVCMLKETTKHLVLEIVKTDTSASASDLSLVAAALDGEKPVKPARRPSELLTVKDVCSLLKISRGALSRWTSAGRIPCLHLAASHKSLRYRYEDIENFLANGGTKPASRQTTKKK